MRCYRHPTQTATHLHLVAVYRNPAGAVLICSDCHAEFVRMAALPPYNEFAVEPIQLENVLAILEPAKKKKKAA